MNRVVVTPAGRRRYLEALAPYVLRALGRGEADRWDLWLNTEDPQDVNAIHGLKHMCPRQVRVVEAPGRCNSVHSIGRFFAEARDPETVYIRLDDDVVWLAEDFFPRLLAGRERYPDAFLVSANVVNNAACSCFHQEVGALDTRLGKVKPYCLDVLGWQSGRFAEYVHRTFLASAQHLWHFPDAPWGNRLSVNAVCWYGRDIPGAVEGDEEAWLTDGRPLMIVGDALCVHYAFLPQREHLEKTDLLRRYVELARTP